MAPKGMSSKRQLLLSVWLVHESPTEAGQLTLEIGTLAGQGGVGFGNAGKGFDQPLEYGLDQGGGRVLHGFAEVAVGAIETIDESALGAGVFQALDQLGQVGAQPEEQQGWRIAGCAGIPEAPLPHGYTRAGLL